MYANKFRWLMATLLLIVTRVSLAQQNMNEYPAQWKKVEAFEKKGLTKSAREEVLKLYELSVKDNREVQQIKACFYLIKYRNMVEEDDRENNIFYLDTLIAKAKMPARQLLQSLQAQLFWQYLQNNRWRLYDRTALTEEKSTDVRTWSAERLHKQIATLYRASLQNDILLKSTKLDSFSAILIKGQNTAQLRPTLYDLLAHRALDYFDNDERSITKPAYAFTIREEQAFAPAAVFASTKFATKDTTSLDYRAVLLLQDIVRFHLADPAPDALLDADLIRLAFMYKRSVHPNKEKLYEAALEAIDKAFPAAPGTAQANFLRASIYQKRGQQYNPFGNTTPQYELKRAATLCEKVVKQSPGTEGAANCQNMLADLLRPVLNLQTEKVNVPDQPFRSFVQYRNVKNLYLRIVKTSAEDLKRMNSRDYENLWKELVNTKPLKQWRVDLPDLQDLQQHATEIKIDALPTGMYLLIGSMREDFNLPQNLLCKQLYYVSNISYINNANDYYVLHRDSGEPLAKAEVQVWENRYNYNTSTYEGNKAERYTTDNNGYFRLKATKDYRTITLRITHGRDELAMDDQLNSFDNYPVAPTSPQTTTFLFTDRSIYRPGQTVYFKGIVVQTDMKEKKSIILPGFSTQVELKDANQQKVADLALRANEFGSFNGSFTLPSGLLNGQFSLQDMVTKANLYFSVEEYKRPKFAVTIDKPKGTYRLNDSVHVTGKAMAFAGNAVDGAKVKYRVVRQVRYPIWWGYGRKGGGYNAGGSSMEITNGELATDAKGEFTIRFRALPDESVPRADQPTFYYEVISDVTDINGESHSASTNVAVAYQALLLDLRLPASLPADSLKTITVFSTNLNGIAERAKVMLTLEKLQAPQRFFRSRYWEQPDQFVMSRDEYYRIFPHDIYKNEHEVAQYPVIAGVWEKTDSSNQAVAVAKSSGGWYKITARATDKYGDEVKAIHYIQLTIPNEPATSPLEVTTTQDNWQPGQRLQYQIRSRFDKLWLVHYQHFMSNEKKWMLDPLAGNGKAMEWLVGEADRGGLEMGYGFVKHNRVYSGNRFFDVPWSNKELDISYTSFRDKLLPGATETWSVQIKGKRGEKVAAEMMTALYDASLDQFRPHSWNGLQGLWPSIGSYTYWGEHGFGVIQSDERNGIVSTYAQYNKSYDQLGVRKSNAEIEPLWWLNPMDYAYAELYGSRSKATGDRVVLMARAAPVMDQAAKSAPPALEGMEKKQFNRKEEMHRSGLMQNKLDSTKDEESSIPNAPGNEPVQVRKNFKETAFFFPALQTDADGNVSFNFTMPEALTQWKLMTMAHTKDLATAQEIKTVITQKQLMVQPNQPRFMREGDVMEISAKVVNLTDAELTGQATLELLDAATGKPVDGWFKNMFPAQYFTAPAGQSVAVKFPIEIPVNYGSALTCRIIARAGKVSDGEEVALPVLTNRMLVTESLPITLRQTNSKSFTFDKLLASGKSAAGDNTTLSHQALTVEFTSNPAWYAVQALPYLMEYPYDCAEQTFNRYYANALAGHITNRMPRIKSVFEKWKTIDTAALLSNLQKNEELKSALLQETPWVMEAQNENQQKKNIALLFDLVKMNGEMTKALGKLKEMQSSNGGIVWFKGGPDDRYITQYIITGLGHLRKLNALGEAGEAAIKEMLNRAIPYLDRKIREDYDNLLRYKVKRSANNLGDMAIQYLYMRSFFPEYPIAANIAVAVNYYKGQAKKYWLSQGKYMQGMIALALHRDGDKKTPPAITRSLRENAIVKEEMGMYWKEFSTGGYYWHQAPIESQAMMIEVFADIDNNMSVVDDLKTWLLRNKQTSNWKTTKATAEACYALLLAGNNWLSSEPVIAVQLGNRVVRSDDQPAEAGTGYFKQRIEGARVNASMGNIVVTRTYPDNKTPATPETAWGSVYWQYFEDLDKITPAATPLRIDKQLFVETTGDRGPLLKPVTDGNTLKVGDKIKVRIELRVDRDMEYVHMKDMRGACMEPVNVISEYKWQGGLGYYESTKDASTNFFFGWLPKGTYVFEYPLFVTHNGNFSNGITTIQCMYAPEFASHSEGVRLRVE